MADSKILAIGFAIFLVVFLMLIIAYTYPKTSGVLANMTIDNRVCINCDPDIKAFGSNINLIFIGVIVTMIALVAVWAVKHYA